MAASVVVIAVVALIALQHRPADQPRTGRSVSVSASGAAPAVTTMPSPGSSAPPTGLVLPRAQTLTASTNHEVATKEGTVQISMTGVNGDGYKFFVITPALSCTVERSGDGVSTVVPLGDGAWVRLIPLRTADLPYQDATDPDFDIPVVFSVESGRGTPPKGARPCS